MARVPNILLRIKIAQKLEIISYYQSLGFSVDQAFSLMNIKMPIETEPVAHVNCRSTMIFLGDNKNV